jgi:hypothetical protein
LPAHGGKMVKKLKKKFAIFIGIFILILIGVDIATWAIFLLPIKWSIYLLILDIIFISILWIWIRKNKNIIIKY